jgi:cytochrome c oxidase subunit 2
VGKWWSVLFGVVMFACGALFVVAPFVVDDNGHAIWWLPLGVSTHSDRVDNLFYIILGITGFFFILTEAILVVFMFQYAGKPGGGHVFGAHPFQEKVYWTSFFKRIFRPVSAILHNQHRVEIAWTLVPSVILLYIAFAQVHTWLDIKDKSKLESILRGQQFPIQIEVSARQFEWRVRYPSSERLESWLNRTSEPSVVKDFKSFANNPQQDDVRLVNEIHLWKDHTLLVQLKTIDVIHSFNIPHMRVKQDALPGKVIPVWFTPNRANTRYDDKTRIWQDGIDVEARPGGPPDPSNYRWEIACAELCGWGHHRMIGRVYVHENREAFITWLKQVEQKQGLPKALARNHQPDAKIIAAR